VDDGDTYTLDVNQTQGAPVANWTINWGVLVQRIVSGQALTWRPAEFGGLAKSNGSGLIVGAMILGTERVLPASVEFLGRRRVEGGSKRVKHAVAVAFGGFVFQRGQDSLI
jgi:hypothetical protein